MSIMLRHYALIMLRQYALIMLRHYALIMLRQYALIMLRQYALLIMLRLLSLDTKLIRNETGQLKFRPCSNQRGKELILFKSSIITITQIHTIFILC